MPEIPVITFTARSERWSPGCYDRAKEFPRKPHEPSTGHVRCFGAHSSEPYSLREGCECESIATMRYVYQPNPNSCRASRKRIQYARVLDPKAPHVISRFRGKPSAFPWQYGVIVPRAIGPYGEHCRSSGGFHLTVYAGFPLRARPLSIVANGATDLSLMGRCPASSHPKARHLSPFSERKARWLG